jgi:uncharacterized protein YndB with AHSA1/START domain
VKIAIVVLGTVVALVLLIAIIGWALPVRHRASRQATYAASPETIYEAITRIEDFPRWRRKVKSAESITSPAGAPRFREIGGNGAILYEVEETVPGRRLVTRIADKSLPFGGSWTYELSPAASGTTLRITEDGEVYNPIFRFVSRFVFGHQATIEAYLTDLGKKLGTAAAITG